jgi:hypothetical protein
MPSIPSLSAAQVRDPVVVQAAAPGPMERIATDKRRPAALAIIHCGIWSVLPADWDACLWQVYLETFGAAATNGPTLVGWRWNVEHYRAEPALPSDPLRLGSARLPFHSSYTNQC